MPGDSYIAFLDILGFSDLVRNNATTDIADLYAQIFRTSLGATFYQIYQEELHLYKLRKPKLQIVSDSIIIWTESDYFTEFFQISIFTSLVLRNAISAGIPLRGSIVHGNINVLELDAVVPNLDYFQSDINTKSSVLFGKGIVDAYLLEKVADWSGCVIDPCCLDFFLTSDLIAKRVFKFLIDEGVVFKKYKVSLKNHSHEEFYVLNWIDSLMSKLTVEEVRESFSRHNKATDRDDIQSKIANTIEFFNDSKNDLSGKKNNVERA